MEIVYKTLKKKKETEYPTHSFKVIFLALKTYRMKNFIKLCC